MRAHRSTRTDTISQKIISGDENVHATKLIQYVRVNDQLGCIWTTKTGRAGVIFYSFQSVQKLYLFSHFTPIFFSVGHTIHVPTMKIDSKYIVLVWPFREQERRWCLVINSYYPIITYRNISFTEHHPYLHFCSVPLSKFILLCNMVVCHHLVNHLN